MAKNEKEISIKSENRYIVDGFIFMREAEAEKAKKESEGVKYIRAKLDMDHPEMVLQVYNKMVNEQMFTTAVGYSYLKDLQEYLTAIPLIKNEDISPIKIIHSNLKESAKKKSKPEKVKKEPEPITDAVLQKKLKRASFFNIVLLICVVSMFIITATSNHPNILNYETKLLNRYSAWEQELNEREAALRELEQNP